MSLKRWGLEELRQHAFDRPMFLCEPLIPAAGIVLLHGPSESGKTQLALTLMKAIAEGTPFLGQFPCRQGKVLLVEVDTPDLIMQERVRRWPLAADNASRISLLTDTIGDIDVRALAQHQGNAELKAVQEFAPDLVVFDALRNIHQLDENDSRTTSIVYGACQRLFPRSALLFIHHDRKKDTQGIRHRDEEASGTGAWRNAANVGLHLERYYDHTNPHVHFATLGFSKLRVETRPLPIRLRMDDESLLVYPTEPTVLQQAQDWAGTTGGKTERDVVDWLLQAKKCSRATAYRIAKKVVSPG